MNEVQARQLRFLSGQKAKAKIFCQGPSLSKGKSKGTDDDLPSQKRTVHVDYLSTPGSQDYCKVAMHMTDVSMPADEPPVRIVYDRYTTLYITHCKYNLDTLYQAELQQDFLTVIERAQLEFGKTMKDADPQWEYPKNADGSPKPCRALYTIDGGNEHINALFNKHGALTQLAERFKASNIGIMKFSASRSKSQQVELLPFLPRTYSAMLSEF